MKVYVFGNQDLPQDNKALEVAEKVKDGVENVQFVIVKPNEDLPFVDEESVVIMDVVEGMDKVQILEGKELEKILLSPRTTVHDFDLSFQLKYLKKLDKLGEVKIIGLPMYKKMNYDSIHSILRKLVAQDMQGS